MGMHTHLTTTTRPDLTFAVYQCARFSIYLKLRHDRTIKRVYGYLKGIADKGMILKINESK